MKRQELNTYLILFVFLIVLIDINYDQIMLSNIKIIIFILLTGFLAYKLIRILIQDYL